MTETQNTYLVHDKFCQIIRLPRPSILNGRVLCLAREEEEGGEPRHLNLIMLSVGVDFQTLKGYDRTVSYREDQFSCRVKFRGRLGIDGLITDAYFYCNVVT